MIGEWREDNVSIMSPHARRLDVLSRVCWYGISQLQGQVFLKKLTNE